MKNIFYIILLLSLPYSLFADESLRRSLTDEDIVLIRESELKFNTCLQENAIEKIDKYPDFRQVAAEAVNDCRDILKDLDKKFNESRLDPNLYHGILNNIKNKAIRQLMPVLMMEKAKSKN